MAQVTTSLFDGVTKDEYAAMKECFKATVKTYKKGEEVPMPEGRVGVVQRGKISVLRTDADGVRTIFEQLGKGGVFGTPIAGYQTHESRTLHARHKRHLYGNRPFSVTFAVQARYGVTRHQFWREEIQ
mgnify:CR=1 FL=1